MTQSIPNIFNSSPGGATPASELDANFLAVQTSLTAEASVATATTVNLGFQPSNNIVITGNSVSIVSFGSSAIVTQPLFFVRFTGTGNVIVQSSAIVTPNAENISVNAGDEFKCTYLGAGNWKVQPLGSAALPALSEAQLLGSSSSSTALTPITLGTNLSMSGSTLEASALSGAIIQQVYTENTSWVLDTVGNISYSDTIPQNNQGTQILSSTITPTNASNKLLIQVNAPIGDNGGGRPALALFQDSNANALCAVPGVAGNTVSMGVTSMVYEMAAGTTSATTFKIRMGDTLANSVSINGNSGGRIYGGVSRATMIITEVTP